ncbi:MAG: DUF4864 domain-containing protein [Rhodospirillales bacterium]|nr:DUF4864 domain-containing protein [Rhodospirillales bacterium]
MKTRFVLALSLLLVWSAPLLAEGVLTPDPRLTPEQVIDIQLRSLQHNDEPMTDAGIFQTWIFAHPDNKQATGPLARFAQMIKSPHYRNMINHRRHSIEAVVQTASRALFAVRLVAADGQKLAFQWELRKVEQGEHAGSWMTTLVSPPLRVGDST